MDVTRQRAQIYLPFPCLRPPLQFRSNRRPAGTKGTMWITGETAIVPGPVLKMFEAMSKEILSSSPPPPLGVVS